MHKNITVNTQSSIRIEGKKILYFDPLEIQEEKHDADFIFITHEHYDHFSPEDIAKIKKEDTVLVAPQSMKQMVAAKADMSSDMCIFLAPGTMKEVGRVMIRAIPAYNNNLKPFHTKGKQWLGYVVTLDGVKYYIAGDTDANADNKKVKCDVAMIPIGGHYTMDKKAAADFVATIKPDVVIPTHYGTIVGNPTDGEEFAKLVTSINRNIRVELKLSFDA